MFMYKQRDVLPARRISTVYTFGAPSVFCEAPLEEEVRQEGQVGKYYAEKYYTGA